MGERSQLNINISPELLKRIKQHATKQGLTITEYVTNTLTTVLEGSEDITLEERMKKLEQKMEKYIIENS
jgi:predicted GIY-YIG superfamily endonuclease